MWGLLQPPPKKHAKSKSARLSVANVMAPMILASLRDTKLKLLQIALGVYHGAVVSEIGTIVTAEDIKPE